MPAPYFRDADEEVVKALEQKHKLTSRNKNNLDSRSIDFRTGRLPYIKATAEDGTILDAIDYNKEWDKRYTNDNDIRVPRPGIVSLTVDKQDYALTRSTLKFNVFTDNDLVKYVNSFITPGKRVKLEWGWNPAFNEEIDKGMVEGSVLRYSARFLNDIGFGWELTTEIASEGINIAGVSIFYYKPEEKVATSDKTDTFKAGLYSDLLNFKQCILVDFYNDLNYTERQKRNQSKDFSVDSGTAFDSRTQEFLNDIKNIKPIKIDDKEGGIAFGLGKEYDPDIGETEDINTPTQAESNNQGQEQVLPFQAENEKRNSIKPEGTFQERNELRKIIYKKPYINMGFLVGLINLRALPENIEIDEFYYTWNRTHLKSADPSICYLVGGDSHQYGDAQELDQYKDDPKISLIDFDAQAIKDAYAEFPLDDDFTGNINGIFLSVDYLLGLLSSGMNKETYTVPQFLQDVFLGIRASTGRVINLTLIHKPDNKWMIADMKFFPQEQAELKRSVFKIGQESLIRNIGLSLEIPNEYFSTAVYFGNTLGHKGTVNAGLPTSIFGNVFGDNQQSSSETPIQEDDILAAYKSIRHNPYSPEITQYKELLEKYFGGQQGAPYNIRMFTNMVLTLDVDGMSGLEYGNPIDFGSGLIPFQINKYYLFLILRQTHTITPQDWNTNYTCQMWVDSVKTNDTIS